jgi:hypothetical protein
VTSTPRSWLRRLLRIAVVAAAVILTVITVFSVHPLRNTVSNTIVAVAPVAATPISNNDAGDELAVTTYNGPMVRYRVAVAVHLLAGTDVGRVKRQMSAAAPAERIGTLTESTFAVFSPELLNYLVPELTIVLPENSTLADGERLMRNHSYPGVGYYLVDSVQVHNITFTVFSSTPHVVHAQVDKEGVLTDSLGKYATTETASSVSFRYFGAVLSDSQVLSDRESIARAAGVDVSKVMISPVISTPSVPLKSVAHHH